MNFYYGGVLGAGIEQLLKDGKWITSRMAKVLKSESKKRLARYTIQPDDKPEIDLQFRLIEASLRGVVKRPFFKNMKIKESQVQVSYPLTDSVVFIGVVDALGIYIKKSSMFEFKTAVQIPNDLFSVLQYDKQIYGYPPGLNHPPKTCCYLIFRKTQKRIKKGQTADEFVQEIRAELGLTKYGKTKPRPEFYYVHHPVTLGKDTLKTVSESIRASARFLETIYDSMTRKELLDPVSWPCNEKQCLNFGTCPFILLCKYPKRWKTYAHLYKQREMLYEEEKQELKS